MSVTLYSCQDDFYVPGTEEIGEGMCDVSLQVAYQPTQTSETRSAGTAMDAHFYTPLVFFFDSDGNVVRKFKLTSGDITNKGNQNVTESGYAEGTYKYGEIEHGKIQVPFGRYRVYVVLEGGAVQFNNINTLADLRNQKLTWSTTDYANNAISFGSCSSADRAINVADNENDYYVDRSGTPHNAPDGELITFNKPKQSISAWTKRLASKVSVSYDASGLNSGIKIYIKSVQIKDIPKSCYLGLCNTPTSADQLQDGELIDYKPGVTDFTGWNYICKDEADKVTFGSSHAQNDGTKNYMYFFENNQGFGERHHTPATGWEQSNYEKYDNKLGTYIEVKGYYVDSNDRNPNQGPITYRFMLGQNTTDDFNAKRSKHYKITLGFNKDADNPDWHIEYADIPDALMLSYGSGLKSNLKLKVVAEPTDVVSVEVTTLYNHWYYNGHKYQSLGEGTGTFADPSYGFFTLEDPATNTAFVGSKTYTGSTQNGAIREIDIPVWSRQMTLGNSFTGYNIFFDHQRYGKIHAVIKVNGAVRYEKNIDIVQVNRLENPSGIWRSSSSTAPFHVRLSRREGEGVYTPIQSYLGPWSAKVITPANCDWVELSKDGTNYSVGETIVGKEDSFIDFYYRPKTAIASTESRYAIIEVRYHNNNCIHYIFCRQGYAPTQFPGQSFKWCTANQFDKTTEGSTPTMEGSMFKFGNEDDAILASNNLKNDYGFYKTGTTEMAFLSRYVRNTAWPTIQDAPHESTARKAYCQNFKTNNPKPVDQYEFISDGTSAFFDLADGTSKQWDNISWKRLLNDSFSTMKVATVAQWQTLAVPTNDRGYGILYGDECTETLLNADAVQYINQGEVKGMRGCFVYDKSTATQIFLPIGATGYGRRMAFDHNSAFTYTTQTDAYTLPWYDRGAHLKYAQRAVEMPYNDAIKKPLYYDIYLQNGSVYWARFRVDDPLHPVDDPTLQSGFLGWDINYITLGFAEMSGGNIVGTYMNAIKQGAIWSTPSTFASDACYVRCVIE